MVHSGASDRPKIKLQPTQYGKTNFIAKTNSNMVHSSIRNEIPSVIHSILIVVKMGGQLSDKVPS